MSSYSSDVAFGLQNQTTVRQLLNEVFGSDHVEQSRYATFDYISSDGSRYVEVKSLRCASTQHPHALMGANKVDAASTLHPNKTVIFVWVYSDGMYYTVYDPALFATFRRAGCIRSNRSGITDFEADTVWVPKEHLLPLRTPGGRGPSTSTDPSLPTAPLRATSLVSA